jgi:arginine-tRNA-protein transferase
MLDFSFINEEFYASEVTPAQTDMLLAQGWRHFGEHFYRYSIGFYGNDIRTIYALRINLSRFKFSKSQRRIFRRNEDLKTIIRPIEITDEKLDLFERHKVRFSQGIPESIYDFLSPTPATVPCDGREVSVYDGERLVAAAFFDVGRLSVSSIYAMFDPVESHRSLGVLTMLLEIQFAIETGRPYYYHGYAYEGNSFYDYKKRFRCLEVFDWQGEWVDFVDDGA